VPGTSRATRFRSGDAIAELRDALPMADHPRRAAASARFAPPAGGLTEMLSQE
jgi:hypothetical protein